MNPAATPQSLALVPAAGTILVVDDHLASVCLLSDVLTHQGYHVSKATTADIAIARIQIDRPALILLDVSLHTISGFELCSQLKSAPETQAIPVILLGTSEELADRGQVFAVGGADYLTKPFQATEVLVRVENQLAIAQQQQALQHQQMQLEQEASDRRHAEASLYELKNQYRSLFENAAEGIFQATTTGQFLSVNPALARIYGYESPEEMIHSISDIGRQLYVQPKRQDELRVYVRQFGYISDAESQVYRKDGSKTWVSENIWTVRDAANQTLYYQGTVQDINDRHRMEEELRQQRRRVEYLLHNILPYQIAQRLRNHRQTIADSFDDVTVLFADLVNFTTTASRIPPKQLVSLLNDIFSAFDQLAERYGIEKIKTIGDAYMVAAGLPMQRADHADAIACMALDMQTEITRFNTADGVPFQIRIGINTGPVVAGVIGIKKFAYDLWGDTVNIASRMESTGEAGRIQVGPATYERLKQNFRLQARSGVFIKGRGAMKTYWLEGKRPTEEVQREGGSAYRGS